MDAEKLLPCPFCGGNDIDPEGWFSENSKGPTCDACGASTGSSLKSHEENIKAWQNRAHLSAMTDGVEATRPSKPDDWIGMTDDQLLSECASISDWLVSNCDDPVGADTIKRLANRLKQLTHPENMLEKEENVNMMEHAQDDLDGARRWLEPQIEDAKRLGAPEQSIRILETIKRALGAKGE